MESPTDAASASAAQAKEPLALQVLEKMSQLMTAAFGFVAALAWNDAIKKAIEVYLPAGGELRALFVYAVAVTFIAVLFGLWIAWATTRAKTRLEKIKLERLRLELVKEKLAFGRRGRQDSDDRRQAPPGGP